jgi:2-succinyl-5-enolpyruvyl-6-hydroxy-3-cyclohexene-1-carboxylate synthase
MNNMQISAQLIQTFLEFGINEFCLCAGARNSPLIKTFEKNPQIKVFHFFEERSAAFFALGRIQSTQRPLVVVTTSGTAVAELLPAVVEAHYSGLPLILLTADRPKNYRGTGAPQAIEHVGIFSSYVKKSLDLDSKEPSLSLLGEFLESSGPLHINVCFDEPLLDQEALVIASQQQVNVTIKKTSESDKDNFNSTIKNFCQNKKPLVILSGIEEKDHQLIIKFLNKIKSPIFIEGTSGLRNHPDLDSFSLAVPEKMAKFLFLNKICDSVIRIGGIPTTRFWRDLEFDFKNIPVLSISNNSFTGLSRESKVISPIDLLELAVIPDKEQFDSSWQAKDQELYKKLLNLFKKFPFSEPSLIHSLSKQLDKKNVYLGNSMPIREWDLAIDREVIVSKLIANRGANGIDGQVSTFLGWAQPDCENWALVGDLTALYDLSSLWIGKQIAASNVVIVVINNGGGMIFNKLFKSEYFLNRHELDFSSWAKMWNWGYEKWEDIPLKNLKSGRTIIELVPNEKQTNLFWEEWDRE